MSVRVRFAPAPSGSLHVGGARTALFNWLFARHHGGTFVLRIEDTDRTRATDESMHALMEALRWLGLDWDEGPDVGGPFGPYRQSERSDRFEDAAKELAATDRAYLCYCTPAELDERRKAAFAAGKPWRYDRRCLNLPPAELERFRAEGRPAAWRFLVAPGTTLLQDLVLGDIAFDHAEIGDFVIMRSDGTPTYLLAAAVDDLAMEISHVIRGKDLLASTPQQIMIDRALGAEWVPHYAHLPLIVGSDRQPLSKRHGAVSIEDFREQGYLPEALVNYLALLGWGFGDGTTERFTNQELIEAFDLKGVTPHDAAFDVPKLTAFNGEKIRELDPSDLAHRLEPFLNRAGLSIEPDLLRRAIPLAQERITRLDEAPALLEFLVQRVEPDEKASKLLDAVLLKDALDALERQGKWDAESIKAALYGWAERKGLKPRQAFQPLRAAITGRVVSLPLFESMELLGQQESLARIRLVT
jgi:glutamyl-tRNA synthetase